MIIKKKINKKNIIIILLVFFLIITGLIWYGELGTNKEIPKRSRYVNNFN